ncbi:MAG: endonuclease domain-containing protein [Cytophagaceae bacterium]
MKINNLPWYKDLRKELRKNSTSAEDHLWKFLLKNQIRGKKFRRQHGVSSYILDFYCPELKLAIEVDGPIHLKPDVKENDRIREEFLNSLGIKVIRFKNEDVIYNIEWVLERIKEQITTPGPSL